MQRTHEANGNTFLLQSAPADSISFFIKDREKLYYKYKSMYISPELFLDWLPSGNWQIIAKADAITEEQAKEIVGDAPFVTYEEVNLLNDEGIWAQTATESLQSLLRSLSLKPEQCLILKTEA